MSVIYWSYWTLDPTKAGHRLLYCKVCRARFSKFKGTPLFNSKLPHDKVLSILEHLAEGCGNQE